MTLLMKTAAHILLTAWLIFATPGVLAQNPPNVSGGHHWVPHGGSQSSQQTELRTIWNELEEHKSTVNALNSRIRAVEERIAAGSLFFLFGAFCALWAQNTGRNAWLWFFAGGFFNFVAVLVLLAKNARDDRGERL